MGVWEASQEVGCLNRPPCLLNQLLPKSFHLALGVLGMPDAVTVYLEDLNERDRWILESRIYCEDGTEVAALLVELLMASILCSFCSNDFLCCMEITQESRSGGGRDIFHGLCGWG